jgi:SAM-dependent methyltransferase
MQRYTRGDLAVFSREEARRFLSDDADPQTNPSLAWELLYRLEPDLYDRLVQAERLHPQLLEWFPPHLDRVVEVGSGTGRLTLALVGRSESLIAIEPAAPLRDRLLRKLPFDAVNIRLIAGFLDALPVPDRSAETVTACSVLTPEPMHGGDAGLREMERVCTPGGRVVIVWPNHVEWLRGHGYRYLSFPGEMTMEFASLDEAVELASIFYPHAISEVRRRGERRVPYDVLGVNPPRDLCYKVVG